MVTFNSNNPLVKKPNKKKRKVKGSTLGSGQLKSTLGAPGKGKKRKPSKHVAQPGTGANWKDLSAKDKVKYTIKGEGKNSVDANNNLNWADGEKKKPKVKVPKTSKTKIPRQSTTASTPTPVVSTTPIQPVEEVEVDVLETPKYSEVYKERKKIKKYWEKKILLFLSSMRSYADGLRKNKFKLDYFKIEDKEFNEDYLKKLKNLKKNISKRLISLRKIPV